MRVVVVGGGSSGCVVAARCAALPDIEVVLVEAGPNRRRGLPANRLPIGPGSGVIDPIPVRIDGQPTVVTRGRVLGGSGAVNGSYFVRARADDFSAWPQRTWSLEAVSGAYRRTEHDLDFPKSVDHGATGAIPVQRVASDRFCAASRAAIRVFESSGLPALSDLNDMAVGIGFGAVPGNIRDGVRMDSATSYFGDAASVISPPAGLSLRTDTTVLSVRIDRGRVRGVLLRSSAGVVEELAADLVVLSAGAVRTPQLLLTSGLGPAAEVAAIGVPPVVDLPGVGNNVRDHPELMLPTGEFVGEDPGRMLEVVAHLEGVEIRPYTAGFGSFIPGVEDRRRHVGIALMRTAAVGRIRLDPGDPTGAPRLDYDLREDRARLVGIRQRRGGTGSLLGPLGVIEGASGRIGMSLHACCSARIGGDDDVEAVLDERCRVRGVDGLRVIDTSAFPTIPSRGPHATAIMFAERASELLLDDLGGGIRAG